MTHPLTTKIRASLELIRPANIVTAFADILAGFSAASAITLVANGEISLLQPELFWLMLSTFGLYGGGVVFNDVFDADLDAKERPERAIPSGRISRTFATILGIILLFTGILAAFRVNIPAGLLAAGITVFALFYDGKAKHSSVWGPLFMGLCRGGNLLLGAAIYPVVLTQIWPLALIPLAYIGAITLISQGEVKGGSKKSGYIALMIVIFITVILLLLSFIDVYSIIPALPFAVLFGVMVIPPFLTAAKEPIPSYIKKAVKRGVISLIILNSTLAAGFAGFWIGLAVLALLPLSMLLSKAFAVT